MEWVAFAKRLPVVMCPGLRRDDVWRGVSRCSRGTDASELSDRAALEMTEGAGKAGCPPHPWSACRKKARGRTTGTGGSSGLPCAMALRLIRDLPGDHAWLPPSSARRVSVFANLTPASERQDHTTSPSAQPPLVAQKLRPAMCVHRIPLPTSVTIASRPSYGCETGESIVLICPTTQCPEVRHVGTTGKMIIPAMSWPRSGMMENSAAPRFVQARSFPEKRHSGATRSGEPGIHNPGRWLWIPGPRQERVPE